MHTCLTFFQFIDESTELTTVFFLFFRLQFVQCASEQRVLNTYPQRIIEHEIIKLKLHKGIIMLVWLVVRRFWPAFVSAYSSAALLLAHIIM